MLGMTSTENSNLKLYAIKTIIKLLIDRIFHSGIMKLVLSLLIFMRDYERK